MAILPARGSLPRTDNRITVVVLLIDLNLLLSLFILLFFYLIEPAIGLDLMAGEHLAEQVEKLR